jgi:hypothetical protein
VPSVTQLDSTSKGDCRTISPSTPYIPFSELHAEQDVWIANLAHVIRSIPLHELFKYFCLYIDSSLDEQTVLPSKSRK